MAEADWNDWNGSVLGMYLRHKDDEVLIWFNRRIEPVVAHLPGTGWIGGLQSDDRAEVSLTERTATLTPRSVVALVREKTA